MLNKQKPPCLVVLSGGQDSTTCLFWAREHFGEVHAVTFNYGQKHFRELQAAQEVALFAGTASHEIVNVGPILDGRSPLTNPAEKLETYASHEQMAATIGDRVELTFVPMRNALFLTLAANRAICKNIYNIVTGVCQEDNANYPDCRSFFIEQQQKAINAALGLPEVTHLTGDWGPEGQQPMTIHTPLMYMTKAETVRLAVSLPGCMDALAYSHTAYSGEYPPITQDHATVLRAQGFLEAGYPDPLIVRAWRTGLMALPETPNYNLVRQREAASLGSSVKAAND